MLGSSAAFLMPNAPCRSVAGGARAGLSAPRMEMQELEFIIYPDGRVEERVLGVKGADCQKLTLKIEQELGEVYHTEAATEMFEQPVVVEVEEGVENKLDTSISLQALPCAYPTTLVALSWFG